MSQIQDGGQDGGQNGCQKATKYARQQGHTVMPETKAMYSPLIDMKPSDPTTMMTAMCEAKRFTSEAGQV